MRKVLAGLLAAVAVIFGAPGPVSAAPASAGPGIWGVSGEGKTTKLSNSTDIKAIALDGIGGVWTLRGDGRVVGPKGAVPSVPRARPVRSRLSGIAAMAMTGNGGTAAFLTTSGEVLTEGDGADGELGDGRSGTGTYSTKPLAVTGLDHVVAIANAGSTLYALRADGTVWAWGDGHAGALGDGDAEPIASRPVRVQGISDVVAIAGTVGDDGYALERDGTVWAWGCGAEGAQGDGSPASAPYPHRVTGLTGVEGITAGAGQILAWSRSGSLWYWGRADNGASGRGYGPGSITRPAVVPGMEHVTDVAVDLDFPVTALAGGRVYTWGGLCASSTMHCRRAPTLVPQLHGVESVFPGAALVP